MDNIVICSKGKVINRKLELEDKESFISAIKTIEENKELYIEVSLYNENKLKEKKRTIQQNKYYHKLLDLIADYTGSTHRDIHLEMKVKFLSNPYIKDDKEYILVGSTVNLNNKNFSEYLERIFNWASEELGLVLPDSSSYY